VDTGIRASKVSAMRIHAARQETTSNAVIFKVAPVTSLYAKNAHAYLESSDEKQLCRNPRVFACLLRADDDGGLFTEPLHGLD
jgi:hypothetical protein